MLVREESEHLPEESFHSFVLFVVIMLRLFFFFEEILLKGLDHYELALFEL